MAATTTTLHQIPASEKPADALSTLRYPWMMAIAIAIAVVGIYHDQSDVGIETYDFSITTEKLEEQDSNDSEVEVGTPQKKICFAALALIGLYLTFVATPRSDWRNNGIAWLALGCLAWALLSYFWSVQPPVTLRELIRLSVVMLVTFGMARTYSANQLMFIALVICTFSVLVAMGSELAGGHLTPWVDGYRLKGGMHANMVAVHAAIMVLASIGLMPVTKRKALLWGVLALAIVAILLTKSRTAAGAMLLAMLIQWSLQLDSKRMVAFWAGMLTVISIVLMLLAAGGSQWQRAFGGAAAMGRQDDVGSLTGRLPLWHTVLADIGERPVQGYGYEAFWTAERRIDVAAEVNWYPTDAHSSYVNTCLELGGVGFVLCLSLALWSGFVLVRAQRITGTSGYAFFATLIAYALIHSLTESGCSAPRIAGLCIGVGVFLAAGFQASLAERAGRSPSLT